MLVDPMIPLLPSCQRRPLADRPMPRVHQTALLLFAVSLVTWAACDKVPLTAPTGSTITLQVSSTSVAVNGSVDVTAIVLESGGVTVHNGTTVWFTTTLGSFEPSQAETHNGTVTVKFRAGTQTGDAQISAVSGAATLSGAVNVTVTS
jgi:hypothetical protein